MKNPWELNRAQFHTLNVLIQEGSEKNAALALKLSPQAVCRRVRQACDLMGADTPLQAAIWWDRFKRDALGPAT